VVIGLTAALGQIRGLAERRQVRFTLKALQEMADLGLGLDPEDVRDVLASLRSTDFAERVQSKLTGEWMYVFKPRVGDVGVYVKVILRDDCLVVSFHEDERPDDEEET
jgi:hypothetical protein